MYKTVLVVDDSMIIRNMAKRTLQGSGFNVITANDGKEGLLEWEKNKNTIDLILTDVNMPVMDGFVLVDTVRKFDTKTPILFLTTESSAERKEKGRDAGAQGWMVKPFAPERLVEVVKKAIAAGVK